MHPDTNKKSMPCPLWVLAILLVGAVLWYALYSYVLSNKAFAIQSGVADRSAAALATQATLVDVSSTADGRDILLTGNVHNEQERQTAQEIALSTHGVRTVVNQIQVMEHSQQSTAAPTKNILRSSAKLEPLPESFPPVETDSGLQATDITTAQKNIDELDLSSISFLHGSATLTETASATLDKIAETLHQNPDIRLHVAGHTDNTGDSNYNLTLSADRAQSVVHYFINQGIEGSRLVAKGVGDRQPIASNETKEGRSKNRRIEFKLLNGEN